MMTPRKTDYHERKDLVLGMVVDRYVRTISPVSSAYISRESSLDLPERKIIAPTITAIIIIIQVIC